MNRLVVSMYVSDFYGDHFRDVVCFRGDYCWFLRRCFRNDYFRRDSIVMVGEELVGFRDGGSCYKGDDSMWRRWVSRWLWFSSCESDSTTIQTE